MERRVPVYAKAAYNRYGFFQSQIRECDERIKECLLMQAAKAKEGDVTDLKIEKKNKLKKNEFAFNARNLMGCILGVDLCKIEGISEISAVELISGIGTEMTKWKSSKHFAAWLNVAPNTKITGGKVIGSKMQKKKNQAGLSLRMSASNLTKSKTLFGDYARKMRSKLGKKGGVVAGAHKLSRIIYTMIKNKVPYSPEMFGQNHQKWRENKIRYLENQLLKLKCTV